MLRNSLLFTRSMHLVRLIMLLLLIGFAPTSGRADDTNDTISSLPPTVSPAAPPTPATNGLLTTLGGSQPETLAKLLISGGVVMIPIIALSIITLALILIYLVTLRRGAVASPRFMTTVETLLSKGDMMGALAISNRHRDIAAGMISSTLEFLARHPEATDEQLREIAQTEGSREAAVLNQRVAWLADIATIAPMLGLLGTVFGMIQSFNVMAQDVAASKPMLLAGGVGQALVATAAGLVVGIPAMGAYAYFRGKVQGMISEMEGATAILLTKLVIARGKNSRF